MNSKEKPLERYIFSEEELPRLKKYLEELIVRKEIIELLDKNSSSFADWSNTVGDEKISFLFSQMANFSETLSEWHKQLTETIEHTAKMIEDGSP